MNLSKLGNKRVVTVTKDMALEEAARLMREYHVGDVVVVEKRGEWKVPIGMLTDRDIVMATTAFGVSPTKLAAGDLMTTNIVTAKEHDSLTHVIKLMKEHGVKRVPLVGTQHEVVGIVALDDVMALLASELSALAEVGKKQTQVESQRRVKFA